MILLSASDLEKHFGTEEVLEGVSFHISKGDRVGIVGDNGAGKTTLLSILSGEDEPSDGVFFVAKGTRIGYLKQSAQFDSENTVLGEMQAVYEETAARAEEWGISVYESEVKGILTSMAFGPEFYDKRIRTLSGGERTRLALASLLLRKPDLLLLDEPTNHLDIGTLKWLESYLKNYVGTLVIVSHDRYFLDQTVTRIFEINRKRLTMYEGDYTTYVRKKKAAREDALRKYEKQQKEIKKEEDLIRWYMGHGTEHLVKRAQSREKRLSHVERLEKPEGENATIRFSFRENYPSGNDVVRTEHLSKGFRRGEDGKIIPLFRNLDLDVKRGERVAIIGPNGIGKSTLLKLLVAASPESGYYGVTMRPDEGTIRYGHNVELAYYDQEQLTIRGSHTVLEEIHADWRLYTETQIRSILGRFLFTGDDVFKDVSALSGGEKARLSLLKMMMAGANVLVFDEPTNHLDISSKEIFEEALLEYPGTIILVSHDRYFLNRIPTRIVELSADGGETFLGAYDYYLEKKSGAIPSGRTYLAELRGEAKKDPYEGFSEKEKRAAQKERETNRKRLEKKREKAEADASRLEKEIRDLDNEMALCSASLDYKKANDLLALQNEKKEELAAAYDAWEAAAEELDRFV